MQIYFQANQHQLSSQQKEYIILSIHSIDDHFFSQRARRVIPNPTAAVTPIVFMNEASVFCLLACNSYIIRL
jgi:hypothetical protein